MELIKQIERFIFCGRGRGKIVGSFEILHVALKSSSEFVT